MPNQLDLFESELESTLHEAMQDIEFELRNVLDDLEEADGFIEGSARNIGTLDRTVRNLGRVIAEKGLGPVIQKQQSVLDDLLGTILKTFSLEGITSLFGGATETTIKLLVEGADAEITSQFGAAENAVAQHLRSAMLGGVKRKDLIVKVKDALKTSETRAKTALNTSLRAMHRKVTVEHARDVLDEEPLFAYLGPKDDSNRDWCHQYVGFMGTVAQWESLRFELGREKQPLPVMVFGGGYNCRHRFRAVLTDAAKKLYTMLPPVKAAA